MAARSKADLRKLADEFTIASVNICFCYSKCLVSIETHCPLGNIDIFGIVNSQDIPIDSRIMLVYPLLDVGQGLGIRGRGYKILYRRVINGAGDCDGWWVWQVGVTSGKVLLYI